MKRKTTKPRFPTPTRPALEGLMRGLIELEATGRADREAREWLHAAFRVLNEREDDEKEAEAWKQRTKQLGQFVHEILNP